MPPVGCQELHGGWTPGGWSDQPNDRWTTPPEAGFRMGRGSSVITVLQVHMDNPNAYAGETDSSGIRLYYTPELRPHDIGDVWSGPLAAFFAVPPETPAWDVGHECVWRQEAINIFATRLHMHGLGKAGWSMHKRRGRPLGDSRLADVERFDYNYQPALYLDEPVRVRRGDSLPAPVEALRLRPACRRPRRPAWRRGTRCPSSTTSTTRSAPASSFGALRTPGPGPRRRRRAGAGGIFGGLLQRLAARGR